MVEEQRGIHLWLSLLFPLSHGYYHTTAGKMIFLLYMVTLYTLGVFVGASAATHREYFSPVCSLPRSLEEPLRRRAKFFYPVFLRMAGTVCPPRVAMGASRPSRCAVYFEEYFPVVFVASTLSGCISCLAHTLPC